MQNTIYGFIVSLLFISALSFSEDGIADEEVDYSLESAYFSTIASGHLEAVRKAPGVVSVITAADIASMGATHLDEVLETVPGLHVLRSDLSRLEPVYSIRGLQSGFNPQVLVLFNGIELKNTLSEGLPSAFHLPLNSIERIEIIKGAGSALYGANAYSGVINIIPKRVRDYMPAITQIRVGSFNSKELTFQYRKENVQGAGMFFSMEQQVSGGDSRRIIDRDLQASIDQQMGTKSSLASGGLNTDYSVTNILLNIENDEWSWNNWFWQNKDAGTGQGVARALDNQGYVDSSSYISHLQYKSIIDFESSIESNIGYHYLDAESLFKLFPNGSLIPIGKDGNPFTPLSHPVLFEDGVIGAPEYNAHKVIADVTYQYIGFEDQIWRSQVGFQYTSFETSERKNYGPGVLDGTVSPIHGDLTDVTDLPYVFLEDQERRNVFFAVQNQWYFHPEWTLTVGGRWDRYSEFGSIFNPRLGLVWEPRHDFTGKLLYGEAFRAPSFSELYMKNNPSGIGSSSLLPERIKTYEIVADYQVAPSLRLINSVYFYKAEDLIENKLVGSVYQFQNAAQQEGYGLEIEAQWALSSQLKLKGQYSYQHSENTDTGEVIADVPNHTGYLSIDYKMLNGWALHLNNHWIGSSVRERTDTRDKLSGYAWSTLKVSKAFEQRNLETAVIVKNLFDENARTPSSPIIPGDYPLEGRSIWAEITYSF
nr:TonB-dependent receptor [Pontibacterium sinense]